RHQQERDLPLRTWPCPNLAVAAQCAGERVALPNQRSARAARRAAARRETSPAHQVRRRAGARGKFRAVAIRPAPVCRTEQVAVSIGDQAAGRLGTVGSVEADQGGGRAGVAMSGLGDLEHRADFPSARATYCGEETAAARAPASRATEVAQPKLTTLVN